MEVRFLSRPQKGLPRSDILREQNPITTSMETNYLGVARGADILENRLSVMGNYSLLMMTKRIKTIQFIVHTPAIPLKCKNLMRSDRSVCVLSIHFIPGTITRRQTIILYSTEHFNLLNDVNQTRLRY